MSNEDKYHSWVTKLNNDERYSFTAPAIKFLSEERGLEVVSLTKRARAKFSYIHGLALYKGIKDVHGSPCTIVGFPGNRERLATIATPKLSNYLACMLEFWRSCNEGNENAPLYILGEVFDDLRRRKFDLLKKFIKNVIVIPTINVKKAQKGIVGFRTDFRFGKVNENRIEYELLEAELRVGDLSLLGLTVLQNQVFANQGTKRDEKIDILAVDSNRVLTVIELKFNIRTTTQALQAAFFQVWDYLRWAEDNKAMLQLIYGMDKVDISKPARMILSNTKGFPLRVKSMAEELQVHYPDLKIDFFNIYLDTSQHLVAKKYNFEDARSGEDDPVPIYEADLNAESDSGSSIPKRVSPKKSPTKWPVENLPKKLKVVRDMYRGKAKGKIWIFRVGEIWDVSGFHHDGRLIIRFRGDTKYIRPSTFKKYFDSVH